MTSIAELVTAFANADWFLITVTAAVILFIGSSAFLFTRIKKNAPNLLRYSAIQASPVDEPSTFDWVLIREIFWKCASFSGGMFIVANVAVFIAFGKWYIDTRALAIIAASYAFYSVQSFDKFYRKLFKDSRSSSAK